MKLHKYTDRKGKMIAGEITFVTKSSDRRNRVLSLDYYKKLRNA